MNKAAAGVDLVVDSPRGVRLRHSNAAELDGHRRRHDREDVERCGLAMGGLDPVEEDANVRAEGGGAVAAKYSFGCTSLSRG